MGRPWMSFAVLVCAWAVAQTITSTPAQAQLDPFFYADTCPEVLSIVAAQMLSAIQNNSRISGSLLRMHFHDCFVQGCDASVLLDGDFTEKTTPPNDHSLQGFDVLDNIKAALELDTACPGVVSCADIIALASFFGVVFSGGPIWVIPLGRGDAFTPLNNTADFLAPPFALLNDDSSLGFFVEGLLTKWRKQNFTDVEKVLVSLSGAHTIGDVRCVTMKDPNNLPSKNPQLNATRQAFFDDLCVNVTSNDSANQVAGGMDANTDRVFDNGYFLQFPNSEEAFTSDLALLNSTTTSDLVTTYQQNQSQFFVDFVSSMIQMGNLNASAAPGLEVRQNCHVPNPTSSGDLRTLAQQSRKEMFRKAPRELTQEEEEKYIQGIRDIIAKVADDYMADYLSKMPLHSSS